MKLLEMETIEDRERWFRELVMEYDLTLKMGEKITANFLDYWTQEKTYKKEQLMLFEIREKQSAFDIRKRMAFWKRNNPRNEVGKTGEKFLDYWSVNYDKKLGDMSRQHEYRNHLKRLGYIFTHSSTAGEIVTPPK